MPKTTNTLAHKARDLFASIQRGPASLNDTTGCHRDGYNRWVSAWILPQLIELIPQLKKDPPAIELIISGQPDQEEPQLSSFTRRGPEADRDGIDPLRAWTAHAVRHVLRRGRGAR